MTESQERKLIQQAAQWIENADALLIGVGSGMSSSAGYNHYHWSGFFENKLKLFHEKYGFTSPFAGYYYLYPSYEHQWGYCSAYIGAMLSAPTGEPYLSLAEIVGDKPHFAVNTNVDAQLERVIDEHHRYDFQGSFAYLQCSQPCHDELYPATDIIAEMTKSLDEDLAVPKDLVPRCPHCGRVMVPWVRDDTFLEGQAWISAAHKYQQFLDTWAKEGKHVVLLEVGVGDMTPSIIKFPFWSLAQNYPNVHYLPVNLSCKYPEYLDRKTTALQGDAAEMLFLLASQIRKDSHE